MKTATVKTADIGRLQDLLSGVFTLCALNSGLTSNALDQLVAKSRVQASRRVAKMRPPDQEIVDVDVLGHVVYIWQRTARYLDSTGRPIAIPARGPAPSVQALFRQIKRSQYFDLGLKHLLQVKRIRRTAGGLYLPCSEVTIVEKLTPELIDLLTRNIDRLISTVLVNTSHKRREKLRLIERITMVPDLPISQVRAFKEFAREQGGALIDTMNDWLESRRGRKAARQLRSNRHVSAGLHVFAFTEKGRPGN